MARRLTLSLLLVLFGALIIPAFAADQGAQDKNCTAIWQQLDDVEKEVKGLTKLQSEAAGKVETLKSAYNEVRTFNEEMRALHRMNLNNAVTSAMLSLMQEAQGFMSGGAVVDVVKWMAGKVIGEAMNRTLGGPSYYTRHLGALKAAASGLTPKLEAFNTLRSLPLEAFKVTEDGKTMGDTGAILRRGRELLASSEAAKHSLYQAYVVVEKVYKQSTEELSVLSSQRESLRARLKKCNDEEQRTGDDEKGEPPTLSTAPTYTPQSRSPTVGTVGVSSDKCGAYVDALQSLAKQIAGKSDALMEHYAEYNGGVKAIQDELAQREAMEGRARTQDMIAARRKLHHSMDLTSGRTLYNLDKGIYPHDAGFAQVLIDTRAAHRTLLAYYDRIRDEYLALASSAPQGLDAMGLSGPVESIVQINTDLQALLANYDSVRRAAGTGCRGVNQLQRPGYPVVDIVTRVNNDLAGFHDKAWGYERKAAQAQLSRDDLVQVFEANLPVVERHFAYIEASADYDATSRLEAARAAFVPARAFLAAESAVQREYANLVGAGVLSHSVGYGGMNNYNLSAEWVNEVAAKAPDKDDACSIVATLREAGRARLFNLIDLRQTAGDLSGSSNYPFPSMGSNTVVKYNLPSLDAALQELAPTVQSLKGRVIAAQQRLWSTSSNVGLLDSLEPGSNYRISGPGVLGGLERRFAKDADILKGRLKVLSSEAEVDLRRPRIAAGEVGRLKSALAVHQQFYDEHLACRGVANPLNTPFPELFQGVQAAVDKLAGKPTYADPSALIQRLSGLRDAAYRLQISDTPGFYAQVKALQADQGSLAGDYERRKDEFMTTDQTTIQGLLDTIAGQLRAFPAPPPPVDDAAVRALYARFAQAYANRDTAGVLAQLDENWRSADGSTIWDVEESLDNSFRVFNEVKYRIAGLSVSRQSDGTFLVVYQSTITGKIYGMDMEHVEKGTVREVVGGTGGNMKVLRTLSGRYSMR